MLIRLCALAAIAGLCLAQDSPDGAKVREQLGLGVQAYREGHFDDAASFFEKAVAIDPKAVNPHLYLGIAYSARWNPGSQTPDNLELARKAESEFLKVLELEPEQISALQSIANMAYQRAMGMTSPADRWEQLTRAAGWYQHLGEVSPKRRLAFYMSGLIAWNKCQPEIDAARREAGMTPDATAPISNPEIRRRTREKCGSVIDDGVAELKKGLEADPDYSEAMNYLSILCRQRASLEDSPEASQRDLREAEDWAQKSAAAARRRTAKHQDSPDE